MRPGYQIASSLANSLSGPHAREARLEDPAQPKALPDVKRSGFGG
jgi:hypothetical protein